MAKVLRIGLIVALALSARSLDAQAINPDLEPASSAYRVLLRAACRSLVPALARECVEILMIVAYPSR
jgi:hypothetical protein